MYKHLMMFLRIATVLITGLAAAAEPSAATAKELMDRAELTGEARDLERAAQSIASGLRGAPRDFPLRRLRARLLLAQGEPAAARDLALALHREMLDDLEIYSLLAVAQARLGELDAAEKNVQWMLDLRPEDPSSFLAAADVRARLNLHEGALQFYAEAVRRFPPGDALHRSQAMARAALCYAAMGKGGSARATAAEALKLAPESAEGKAAAAKAAALPEK